jgi:hypothetical protein
MSDINPDTLRELASNAKQNTASIAKALGLGNAAQLYYAFSKNPDLKFIYDEGRKSAGVNRKSSRAPKPKARKKAASTATPPASRMPRAGSVMSC